MKRTYHKKSARGRTRKKAYKKKWFFAGAIIRKRGKKSFQVEINRDLKRTRVSFKTLEDARVYANEQRTLLANEGLAAFELTPRERQDAAEALDVLGGTPLVEAARFYVRHHKPAGGVRTINELMAEYLVVKKKANRRPATLGDMRSRIGGLARAFGDRHVHTLTVAELSSWLDEHTKTPISRNNYRRVFVGFFNFARKQGLVELNPAGNIEISEIDEKLPEVFTPTEAQRILNTALKLKKRMIPFYAIGFFAGLRTSELQQLDWSSVDFESKLITVRPETAKKRRQRHVAMSDNLIAWLLPHRKSSGRVCPADCVIRRWRDRILKKAGIKRWLHNGMRHSFASYHLVKHQDAGRTALELGHISPTIVFDHYRNLVKPTEAEQYWDIRPRQDGQVIELHAETA